MVSMPMNRHASLSLRRFVDTAVGAHYGTVFLRLDLLTASREARCGCDRCTDHVVQRRTALVASLPSL